MTQLLIIALFILSLISCVDASKTKDVIVKTQHVDTTFIPDSFASRDDTASFNVDKGNLSGNIMTLDVSFGAIACTCAQWSETKYSENTHKRTEFYLEPANTSLINADTLFNGDNFPIRLLVTGQFYLKEGYPKNYRPAKGEPNPARVFCYTKIKIKKIGSSL